MVWIKQEFAMDFIAPEISTLDLAAFMQAALHEADLAGQAGEYPIGAVVVIDGTIIARGRATHNAMKSQIRHAELNAILAGGEPLWRDFRRAILFTTVEPCPLCLGAAVMADIPHIIFALHDKVVQTDQIVETNPYVRRHIRSYHGGVLAGESQAILARYDPKTLEYIQQYNSRPVQGDR
jgi:tRNA(adenine34) deaminase